MMNATFSIAVSAANTAAGGQNYPHNTLYVVATPIGNMMDISLRALHVLSMVDAIACEDTRHTQTLLRQFGLHKPLLAVHQHNEREGAESVVARLHRGERIAYVSDAGTPGVSDPGARLCSEVRAAGLRCVPLPGASSVTALVSVAGLVANAANGAEGADALGYVFHGFLPTKAKEREVVITALSQEPRAVVLLEAPHRIEALTLALATLGQRQVTVGRELTKQFEEIATMPAEGLAAWLKGEAHRTQGEFALVLHPVAAAASVVGEGERVLRLLLAELPTKTAVKLAADITGEARNALYALALSLKK